MFLVRHDKFLCSFELFPSENREKIDRTIVVMPRIANDFLVSAYEIL